MVGAGHAHLQLVREAGRLHAAGLEVTLIAPPRFQYSGLASGILSGALAEEAGEIDVAALAAGVGLRHLTEPVNAIDRTARSLVLAGGASEPFDLLSLNIGSVAADPYDLAAQTGVWPVKPLVNLFALRTSVETVITRGAATPRIVVAGGGLSERKALIRATEAFEAVLARHVLAVEAARVISEGLVKAIAEEVASVRGSPSAYGASGQASASDARAVAMNRTA